MSAGEGGSDTCMDIQLDVAPSDVLLSERQKRRSERGRGKYLPNQSMLLEKLHVGSPGGFAEIWICVLLSGMQVGFFDDKVGPITLASIVLVTLIAITIMAFIDVVS
jgi:hypothetical protein